MSYTNGLDKPSDYFETKLYVGNESTNAITGLDFQPDLVWLKNRDTGYYHGLYDSVRGTGNTKSLYPNAAEAEGQNSGNMNLASFNSDGFTLGATSSTNIINKSSQNHVSWNWKAGTSFTNDASATSIGTIDSTGSFNNDSGFSIVSYTGNNTSGATLKHGLNTAPAMVILRNRNLTNNRDWVVYHQKLTSASYYIFLNSTGAMAGAYANFWNNTAPNSSVITLGSGDTGTNGNGDTYIAYCFAEKQGYSKFGSYTGNGNNDGTFVYTGFSPSFVLGKRTDSGGGWWILDSKRPGFNLTDDYLLANDSQAEADDGSFATDFLSNGWKARATNGNFNASGGSYIYMAFAENPFVTSTGVPATAR
jgi:hypothetical protein